MHAHVYIYIHKYMWYPPCTPPLRSTWKTFYRYTYADT